MTNATNSKISTVSTLTEFFDFTRELVNEAHDSSRQMWEDALTFSMTHTNAQDAIDSLKSLQADLIGNGYGARWI